MIEYTDEELELLSLVATTKSLKWINESHRLIRAARKILDLFDEGAVEVELTMCRVWKNGTKRIPSGKSTP